MTDKTSEFPLLKPSARFGTPRVRRTGEILPEDRREEGIGMLQVESISEGLCRDHQRADVETVLALGPNVTAIEGVLHDSRNIVTALKLYCDLLQEPGVLTQPFAHYGRELRLVAAASHRLVQKLTGLHASIGEQTSSAVQPFNRRLPSWRSIRPEPIKNLAEELLANRNLLSSIAGPTVVVTMDAQGGAMPVRMTSEDLTRVLMNLIKHAVETMAGVGRIHITLRENSAESQAAPCLALNVEHNGPGLTESAIEELCSPSLSMQSPQLKTPVVTALGERGLGLAITRSIVESAGGLMHPVNRDAGVCFEIQLPFGSESSDVPIR